MAKIIRLEKFKGELNGTYQTLWVAISEKGNLFTSENLELKQVGEKVVNDIKSTKWKHISNEHYSRIRDEMLCVSTENYLQSNSNPKHFANDNEHAPNRNEVLTSLTKRYAQLHDVTLHHSGAIDFDQSYSDLENEMSAYSISYEDMDEELLRLSEEKNRTNIVKLEKYKGDYHNTFKTLLVAISERGAVFTKEDNDAKLLDKKVISDIHSSQWETITKQQYADIQDNMKYVASANLKTLTVGQDNNHDLKF